MSGLTRRGRCAIAVGLIFVVAAVFCLTPRKPDVTITMMGYDQQRRAILTFTNAGDVGGVFFRSDFVFALLSDGPVVDNSFALDAKGSLELHVTAELATNAWMWEPFPDRSRLELRKLFEEVGVQLDRQTIQVTVSSK